MNFNQPEYGVLLVAVFWGFWAARRRARLRESLVLAASYLFYGAWNPYYLVLLALTTVVDWAVGLGLGATTSPERRRLLLVASLGFNLTLLGVFKYYDFFAQEAALGLARLGIAVSPPLLAVVLPAGISFYTFQTMNYVIDVYRGVVPPCRSLLQFAVFVSFFPHLVAGPILRARLFLPQVAREPVYDHARALQGVYRILVGLAKKAVLADFVGRVLVDPVFADVGQAGSAQVLLALYAYAVQIYADFSGYSDIAIGSAALLGFEIPENFLRPYAAPSLREFWRRWHVSLSSWLRDYLYIPLGGNRRGPRRQAAALAATMLLGGLWHGARWTYVAWGALHGLGLAAERRFGARGRLATFHFVCLAWLFFRADSLEAALAALARLTRLAPGLDTTPEALAASALVAGALALHLAPAGWKERLGGAFRDLAVPAQAAVATLVLLVVAGLASFGRPFIYFQF